MSFSFTVTGRDPGGIARAGIFHTPHGDVPTPAFLPVGTRGTVKGVLPRDLAQAGSTMVLANALHLHLRPGEATVAHLGGLHRFMNWDGPLLTDSGGYQVFSLAHISTIDDDGVTFRSVVDGDQVRITPERAIDIQLTLGADVIMAFDQCPGNPHDRGEVQTACDRTHRWLARCADRWHAAGGLETGQALFGIVQGGSFEDLRRASVDAVASHDFVGYAVGGVSVGEDREAVRAAVAASAPYLPEDKPRYLMGVGTPRDFFDAVELGVDLFDCVTPTRHGRTHQAFTTRGRVNLRNSGWKDCDQPLDPECESPALKGFSMGVLRHLCRSNEMLGAILVSLHNLHFFHSLMTRIRTAIVEGRLAELRREVLAGTERKLTPDGPQAG